MDLLAITLTKPNGFWPTIIFGMEDAIGTYALALILVTAIIKLVLVPFDVVNKLTSKKSARKQAEMKPELDKIKEKYANDNNMINQKTMELYKTNNYSVMGTCLGMVVYLVVTMVVFWTLFSALNTISYYKIGDQYLQVREAYFAEYGINVNELADDQSAYDEYLAFKNGGTKTEAELAEVEALAKEKALAKYDELKTSFLWIENIWIADSTTSPVMNYKDFISKSKLDKSKISQDEYSLIMEPIKGVERKSNGFFVLAVLAAGTNFLSIFINNCISKSKAKKQGVDPELIANNGGSGKIMTIIMPLIMGVFTLLYNAAFGLYIVAGALIALITGPLETLFVDMLEIEAIKKEQKKSVSAYDRRRLVTIPSNGSSSLLGESKHKSKKASTITEAKDKEGTNTVKKSNDKKEANSTKVSSKTENASNAKKGK